MSKKMTRKEPKAASRRTKVTNLPRTTKELTGKNLKKIKGAENPWGSDIHPHVWSIDPHLQK